VARAFIAIRSWAVNAERIQARAAGIENVLRKEASLDEASALSAREFQEHPPAIEFLADCWSAIVDRAALCAEVDALSVWLAFDLVGRLTSERAGGCLVFIGGDHIAAFGMQDDLIVRAAAVARSAWDWRTDRLDHFSVSIAEECAAFPA